MGEQKHQEAPIQQEIDIYSKEYCYFKSNKRAVYTQEVIGSIKINK